MFFFLRMNTHAELFYN